MSVQYKIHNDNDSYLDVLDSSEGPEELPEDVLLRLRGEVVDENAPAGAVGGRHPGQQRVARQQVSGQRRIPATGAYTIS